MASKSHVHMQFGHMRRCFGLLGLLASLGAAGCLRRPVGEAEPETYNMFLNKVRLSKVDKIDVLLMVDNSPSMADKQKVMAAAVPQLLRRLTSPDCVNPSDPSAAPIPMEDPNTSCEKGYQREFSPVKDIHIGVITSSLGDFGGDNCTPKPDKDTGEVPKYLLGREDGGWLLGSLPRTKDVLESPFLTWSPSDAQDYSDRIEAKVSEFRDFVTAAGEHGCGYEMSLESWYRFLVDPEPPKDYKASKNTFGQREGIDDKLIEQRRSFLRPDSLLAVIMLTDENDCSLKDDVGHLMMSGVTGTFKSASSACATDPNDPCCYSCLYQRPAGCPEDPKCAENTNKEDVVNLRCFDQKQRYGEDFLYPTARYVNALRLKTICPYQNYGTLDCDCTEEKARGITDCERGPSFPNPIFDPTYSGSAPGMVTRTDPDMVFLAGIVGVPWQDIAESEDGNHRELRYKLSSAIDWDLILPQTDGTPARDPLMHEQREPRSGTHPITGEPIGLAERDNQRELNSINWHEWESVMEVQYSCVFDISQQLSETPEPARDCAATCEEGDLECKAAIDSCPCKKDDQTGAYGKSPLCQDKNGVYGTIQHAAKAYPGIRQLEVLRGHNATAQDNSIIASICPRDLNWENRNSRGYGYNPAVQALVDRLKTKLAATCLPRPLVAEDGKLPCAVVEAIPPTYPEWSQCDAKGRDVVGPSLREAVRASLKADKACDGDKQPGCNEFTFCQLRQLTDEMDPDTRPLTRCQTQIGFENSSNVPGFCYVDPDQDLGDESIVDACPVNRRRMLRIVGDGDLKRAPAPGSWTFIACMGAANRPGHAEADTQGEASAGATSSTDDE